MGPVALLSRKELRAARARGRGRRRKRRGCLSERAGYWLAECVPAAGKCGPPQPRPRARAGWRDPAAFGRWVRDSFPRASAGARLAIAVVAKSPRLARAGWRTRCHKRRRPAPCPPRAGWRHAALFIFLLISPIPRARRRVVRPPPPQQPAAAGIGSGGRRPGVIAPPTAAAAGSGLQPKAMRAGGAGPAAVLNSDAAGDRPCRPPSCLSHVRQTGRCRARSRRGSVRAGRR